MSTGIDVVSANPAKQQESSFVLRARGKRITRVRLDAAVSDMRGAYAVVGVEIDAEMSCNTRDGC